jgi:hypothetical protein
LLTHSDVFAAVLAAAMHDYAHPGTNNSYHVNAQTPLALRYNDHAVLENMHASEAFLVMKREGCDILAGLDANEQKDIRESIISMILATDMKRHFSLLSDLKVSIEKRRTNGEWFDVEKKEDRMQILCNFIHGADIGNPIKPVPEFIKWTDILFQEFFAQGDKEKEQGLPVSMLCDRETTVIPKAQAGFCRFIVKPLYVQLMELTGNLNQPMQNLEANLAEWDGRVAEWQAEQDSQENNQTD